MGLGSPQGGPGRGGLAPPYENPVPDYGLGGRAAPTEGLVGVRGSPLGQPGRGDGHPPRRNRHGCGAAPWDDRVGGTGTPLGETGSGVRQPPGMTG